MMRDGLQRARQDLIVGLGRDLADELGINRNTVASAYRRLVTSGIAVTQFMFRQMLELELSPDSLEQAERSFAQLVERVEDAQSAGLLAAGDRIIVTNGDSMERRGATNTLRLLEIGAGGHVDGLGEI